MRNDVDRASANLTADDLRRDISAGSWFNTAARSDPSNIVERRENRYRELLSLPAGETGALFEGLAPDGDPLDGLRAMQAYASGGRPDVELSPAAEAVFEGWADDERRHSFAAAEAGIIQGMVGWGYNNPIEAAAVTLASFVLTPAGSGLTRLSQALSYGGRTAAFEGGLELFAGMHRRAEAKASYEAALGEDYDLLTNTAIEVIAAGGLGGIFGALEGAIRKPNAAGAVVKPGDTLLSRLFPKHEKIVVDGREVEIGKMTHDDMMGVLREKFGARPYYFPVARSELADALPAADLEKFDELPGQEGELTEPQLEFLRERGIEPERGVAIDGAWVAKLGLPDEIVGQNRVQVGNDFIYTSLHPVLENALLTTKLRQIVDEAIRPPGDAPAPDPAVGPDVEGGEIRANFRQIVRDLGDEGGPSLRTDDPDGVAERILMWYNTAFLAKVPRARRERFNPAGKGNDLYQQHARELIFKSILHLKEGGELDEAFARQVHEDVRGPYMTRDDAIKAGIDPQLLNEAGAHTPELLVLELATKDRAAPRYFLAKYTRAGADHPHEVLRELTEAELRGAGGEAGVRPQVRTYKPMLEKRPVPVKWHPIVPEKGGSVIWNPDDPTKRDLLDPLEATGKEPPPRPDPHANPPDSPESAPPAPAPAPPPPKPEIVEQRRSRRRKGGNFAGNGCRVRNRQSGGGGGAGESTSGEIQRGQTARRGAVLCAGESQRPLHRRPALRGHSEFRPGSEFGAGLRRPASGLFRRARRRFSAGPKQEKDGVVFWGSDGKLTVTLHNIGRTFKRSDDDLKRAGPGARVRNNKESLERAKQIEAVAAKEKKAKENAQKQFQKYLDPKAGFVAELPPLEVHKYMERKMLEARDVSGRVFIVQKEFLNSKNPAGESVSGAMVGDLIIPYKDPGGKFKGAALIRADGKGRSQLLHSESRPMVWQAGKPADGGIYKQTFMVEGWADAAVIARYNPTARIVVMHGSVPDWWNLTAGTERQQTRELILMEDNDKPNPQMPNQPPAGTRAVMAAEKAVPADGQVIVRRVKTPSPHTDINDMWTDPAGARDRK